MTNIRITKICQDVFTSLSKLPTQWLSTQPDEPYEKKQQHRLPATLSIYYCTKNIYAYKHGSRFMPLILEKPLRILFRSNGGFIVAIKNIMINRLLLYQKSDLNKNTVRDPSYSSLPFLFEGNKIIWKPLLWHLKSILIIKIFEICDCAWQSGDYSLLIENQQQTVSRAFLMLCFLAISLIFSPQRTSF